MDTINTMLFDLERTQFLGDWRCFAQKCSELPQYHQLPEAVRNILHTLPDTFLSGSATFQFLGSNDLARSTGEWDVNDYDIFCCSHSSTNEAILLMLGEHNIDGKTFKYSLVSESEYAVTFQRTNPGSDKEATEKIQIIKCQNDQQSIWQIMEYFDFHTCQVALHLLGESAILRFHHLAWYSIAQGELIINETHLNVSYLTLKRIIKYAHKGFFVPDSVFRTVYWHLNSVVKKTHSLPQAKEYLFG